MVNKILAKLMCKLKYILIISLFISLFGCDNYDITSEQADTFVKVVGSRSSNTGMDIKDFNNGYLILATVTTSDNQEIVLLQTDKFGNLISNGVDTLSSLRGGNNTASKLLLTLDGGFIVLGTVEDTANNNTDIYLNKFSAGLTSDWEKTIGTSDDETAASIQITDDGYIIAGSTDAQDVGNDNSHGSLDIYLVKIDDQGNVEWTENYGGSGDEYASDVILINNGFLVVGTTNGFNGPGQAKDNIILVKTNTTGGDSDMETYGSSNNDYGNSLIKSSDGGFIILGTVEDVTGSKSDIYVIKLESESESESYIHNIIWDISHGGADLDDLGYEVIKSDGGYIIVGSKELETGYAGYFLKIDSEGEVITEQTYGGYGQTMNAIEATPDGGFVMTGSSGIEGSEMISLIKVNSEGEL